MPDLQPSVTSAASNSAVLESITPAVTDDFDYALGCECADPTLQIERWSQEAVPSGAAN